MIVIECSYVIIVIWSLAIINYCFNNLVGCERFMDFLAIFCFEQIDALINRQLAFNSGLCARETRIIGMNDRSMVMAAVVAAEAAPENNPNGTER